MESVDPHMIMKPLMDWRSSPGFQEHIAPAHSGEPQLTSALRAPASAPKSHFFQNCWFPPQDVLRIQNRLPQPIRNDASTVKDNSAVAYEIFGNISSGNTYSMDVETDHTLDELCNASGHDDVSVSEPAPKDRPSEAVSTCSRTGMPGNISAGTAVASTPTTIDDVPLYGLDSESEDELAMVEDTCLSDQTIMQDLKHALGSTLAALLQLQSCVTLLDDGTSPSIALISTPSRFKAPRSHASRTAISKDKWTVEKMPVAKAEKLFWECIDLDLPYSEILSYMPGYTLASLHAIYKSKRPMSPRRRGRKAKGAVERGQ